MKYFKWFENLKKQDVPSAKQDTSNGIVNWQTDKSRFNDFPQQLLQNVYNSPVGSAALDVWQEFVEGDGLTVGGDIKINTTETLNDLNAKLSADLVFMWGLSFIQKYTPEGKPTFRFHLPFEETRIAIPISGDVGKIYHNPYFGIAKSFDEASTVFYYAYNPAAVVDEIKMHNDKYLNKKTGLIDPPYPGQAYWYSIERPLARVYPQPFYYSSMNWFQVDAEIQSFHERNIKNNLLLSVMINMHGDPSAPAGAAEAKTLAEGGTLDQEDTVGGEFEKQMKQFVNEKGGVLVNWFLKEEERATFEQFPTNSHHDLFLTLQNIVADQIAIGTKVPKILIGISVPGQLGNNDEILNAIRLMQGRTRRMRNILERIYKDVFKIETQIKNINPVNVIPAEVWATLTLEEQRGYVKRNFDVELITIVAEENLEEFTEIKITENGN
ncbi:MAG: hypothetical protein O2887_10395 [Bacteroidetes bacterium]|nr:hypothetical protein [Bacteroidota bacterium]